MPPADHPLWKLLFLGISLGAIAAYMEIMYKNGFDPMKDGGLLALASGLAVLWSKMTGGEN